MSHTTVTVLGVGAVGAWTSPRTSAPHRKRDAVDRHRVDGAEAVGAGGSGGAARTPPAGAIGTVHATGRRRGATTRSGRFADRWPRRNEP